MTGRRFLLMYVNPESGHHRASLAVENALRRLDPSAHITSVDAFRFTNPLIHWAISRSYLSLIKHQPDVWEYLYDNPDIHRRVQHLRRLLHQYQGGKLKQLLEDVRPDAIACTQAYPCGVVADFKQLHQLRIPIVGVLTDYAPHLYWFHEAVDVYVVPSEQVKQRFLEQGVDPARVRVLGIPIDATFAERGDRQATARAYGLDPTVPVVLIMGGGSGFGRLREVLLKLDTLPNACQFVVVCGTNRSLLAWAHWRRFRHRVIAVGFTTEIAGLMDLATLLISKPGGLTTSEALAKRLPLVIVNPIPGQEAYNARYLLSQGAVVEAAAPETVRQTVRDLLEEPERLRALRTRSAALAHPQAARDTAQLLCELADDLRAGGGQSEALPRSALA